MRIIAGTLKGRRLEAPSWPGLRPTSDKLRETLFNMVAARVAGARVLDGFAGTGALGLEALSRGAREVVLVESDPRALALIARNVAHCGVGALCTVVSGRFAEVLADWRRADAPPFDLVLLDPPYGTSLQAVLDGLDGHVAASGLVVVEHASREVAPALVAGLVRVRDRRSGDSTLTFYARAGDAA